MTSRDDKEYSPEGYPRGCRLLALEAKKRLDKQRPSAERGKKRLDELREQLRKNDDGKCK